LKKERKEESFIKNPYYKDGAKAFTDFVYGNLKYPKDAVANKIEGLVICKYDIDHDGNVIDVKVIKSLGYGCDEEAIRVVKLLKFEVPKTPRKLRIIFHKDIKIQFKMKVEEAKPIQPPQPQKFNINYITTPINSATAPAKKELPKPAPVSYTYTIKI
jgi:TonB family protein